jgi:hypothetical protein
MALLSGNATWQRWEPQSIRLHLIRVAGKLLTGANQLRLKRARPPLAAKVWQDWLALSEHAKESAASAAPPKVITGTGGEPAGVLCHLSGRRGKMNVPGAPPCAGGKGDRGQEMV